MNKLALGLVCLIALMPTVTNAQRVAGKKDKLKDAAASPLYDVNVLKTKIPPVLIEAEATPYKLPSPLDCETIASEIAPLDEALGPDLDIPPSLENPSALERSTEFAKDGSVALVRSGAQGLIPLRGVMRTLSGAERADRIVRESITAGGVRRAFLKGLGLHLKCGQPTAAPNQIALDGVDLDPPRVRKEPQYPTR